MHIVSLGDTPPAGDCVRDILCGQGRDWSRGEHAAGESCSPELPRRLTSLFKTGMTCESWRRWSDMVFRRVRADHRLISRGTQEDVTLDDRDRR
jgi:hypothetical protein